MCRILKQNLHEGEAESIVLALESPGSLLLLDETEARKVANLYNINITGVVGILIRAKIDKNIFSLRNELDKLRGSGFWVSDEIYDKALKSAGE